MASLYPNMSLWSTAILPMAIRKRLCEIIEEEPRQGNEQYNVYYFDALSRPHAPEIAPESVPIFISRWMANR